MQHRFYPSILRSQRLRFVISLTVLFLAISGLAFAQGHTDASAGALSSVETLPGGTIPPGTIPPGPGPTPYGLINMLHLAPIDSDSNNTAIDICDADGNVKINGPLIYEGQTGYKDLSWGEYDWFIAPAGSDCGTVMYDIPRFTIHSGAKLVLAIYGGANGQPLTSVLIVAEPGTRIYFQPVARTSP